MNQILTTTQVANLLGLERYQVTRLFYEGDLPEPDKFCGRRAIFSFNVPAIREAAVARGWLEPSTEPEAVHA